MYILGIDTSALSASAALAKDGKIISESYVNIGLTHSQTLFCLIDSCLKNAQLDFSDVDIVAVAAGPGSFTGIRIGVSAVKGLCFSENKPCYAVSTLEAIAFCADIEGFVICPVMDARCNQVYNALFEKQNGELKRLLPDIPKTLDSLCVDLSGFDDKRVLIVGDGTDVTAAYLEKAGVTFTVFSQAYKFQRASGVALAAFGMYNKNIAPLTADELRPEYLRLSQAERERIKAEENKNDSIKQ